jgi:hypothetical protein
MAYQYKGASRQSSATSGSIGTHRPAVLLGLMLWFIWANDAKYGAFRFGLEADEYDRRRDPPERWSAQW